jgi:translocation and assembly module TamB
VKWPHLFRRVGRHTLRLVLLVLLLALLCFAALLAVLGSESGSRWLLERGMSVQDTLTARYEGGTLLNGLTLSDLHFHTARTDLQVRRVVARWSLWQLLRGEIVVHRLEGQGLVLRKLAPGDERQGLPTLILPLHLGVRSAVIDDLDYWGYGATKPRTLRRLELTGTWQGSRVRVERLHAEQDRVGVLDLAGRLRLRDGYPLEASGRLDYRGFREKGWQPLAVQLGGKVEALEIRLDSKGPLTASASGLVRPLKAELPYEASMSWQAVALPWWSDQNFRSQKGSLQVTGNRLGLQGRLDAQLSGRNLPAGQYNLKGRTSWKSANIESLLFNGLGGKAQVSGEVAWGQRLSWDVTAKTQQIDPSRHWPVPRQLVPPLSGDIVTKGHTKKGEVAITAQLRLAGGERWDIEQSGSAWPWQLDVPQKLSASWANVRRQVGGQTLSSAAGELEAEGSRQDYWLLADAQLAGTRFPVGQWTAELGGARRQAGSAHLEYQGEAGALTYDGTLVLAAPLRWQGRLTLDNFASGWLSPAWPGSFSGTLEGGGEWGAGQRRMSWQAALVEGQLRDQPFRLQGPFGLALPEGHWPEVYSPGLALMWGRNQANVTGGLQQAQWSLLARLDLGDLHTLLPGWRGKVKGEIALQGPERRPDVQANLAGDGVGLGAWTARNGQLNATVLALGDAQSQATLELDGLTPASGADWGRLRLELNGTRPAHTLGWMLEGDRLGSQGRVAGALAGRDWSGRMEAGQFSLADMQWQLGEPFALAWEQADRQVRVAPHCWQSDSARLCNEADMRLGPRGNVQLSLAGLDLLQLRGLMPEGLELAGLVEGTARGGWQPGTVPSVHAELAARQGEFRLAREGGQAPLVLGYERIALAADAGARNVDLQFDLQSPAMGQGSIRARVAPLAEGKPMQGRLDLAGFRLDVLQPFFPALSSLGGEVSASGDLGGTLSRPDFQGSVQLRKGQMAFQRLPLQIQDIDSDIAITGRQAQIRGSMRGGEGTATLEGNADWSAEPRLDLALRGSRFRLSQPPMLLADVDPDLRLHMEQKRADLTGTIRVPMARLNLKPLTARAVPLSPDIRVVSAADREGVTVTGNVADWDVNADIRLLLGDDVYFHGYGVNGPLLGSLRLRQEGKRGLEAHGDVELGKEARYDAYGQRLEIRRGRLIFAGNLSQPGLDVEAIREVDNKVVGVRVQGRANAPEATLFSDQSMSQEEMVSYLVLGRPLDATGRPDSGAGNLTAAAAAIKLGATGGAGLTSRVGETFGISDLAVDAEGSGDDTQFTVSGYISPKLYLRYGVGIFTPVNTATVRYKINSKLYLEAMSSLESAIDLFYNVRF